MFQLRQIQQSKKLEWTLRIALCGEFLGHGWYAFQATPGFQALLAGSTGLSIESAATLLPVIGIIDFAIAALAWIKPIRIVLLYAAIWGFLTALSRPVSGAADIFAFIERLPNYGVPLALLWFRGYSEAAARLVSVEALSCRQPTPNQPLTPFHRTAGGRMQ
jgi:hypothetical protein